MLSQRPRGRKRFAAITALKRPYPRVRPHMIVQVSLSTETLQTLAARERHLSRMLSEVDLEIGHARILGRAPLVRAEEDPPISRMNPGMLFQIGLGHERLSARDAQERTLPGVTEKVGLEMSLLNEGLVAEVAFERPLVRVRPRVLLQRGRSQESEAAMQAEVFSVTIQQILGSSVHRPDMVVDMGLLDELLAANGACVRPGSRMDQEMLLQGRAAGIGPVATGAGILLSGGGGVLLRRVDLSLVLFEVFFRLETHDILVGQGTKETSMQKSAIFFGRRSRMRCPLVTF